MEGNSKKHINLFNRKIVKLLINLNKTEVLAFLNYLETINHGITKKEIDFLQFLTNSHPIYDAFPVDMLEKFFDKEEKKAKVKLNKTLHQSCRLLEKWLIYREVDKDALLLQQLLIKVYANRTTPSDFSTFKGTIQKLMVENIAGFPDYFYTQFKIESTIFHYPHTTRYKLEEQLGNLMDYLDQYYVAQKLRLICQQLSRSRFMQEKPDIAMYDAVVDYAQKHSGNNTYFQLYLKLIQLFEKHDTALLLEIKRQFVQELKIFSRIEQAIFLHLLINHVVLLTNARQSEFIELQFELYQLAIKKDLILFNNGIPDEFFYNILQAACHVKEFAYAKKFIDQHGQYLAEGTASVLIPFSKAFIAFHQKKFVRAEEGFRNIHFKKNDFKLISRSLHLKCLYELSEKDEFYQDYAIRYAGTFLKFIKPHKVFLPSKKALYIAFIKLVLKLLKLKNKSEPIRKKHQKELIALLESKTTKIASRKWLVEKIKEF